MFDLRPPERGERQWVIGRSRGADIPLDFDPFLSAENSAVTWERGGHFVENLAHSRNGTTLNFQQLPKGERRAVRTGDVIGVGRSLLLFRG